MNSPNPAGSAPSGEPQVHFCNICNQSVPESAIDQGRAIRVPDGIAPTVGAGSPRAGRGGTGLVLGAAALVVAAVVAMGLFLDWRLDQTGRNTARQVQTIDGRVEGMAQRMVTLEQRLATTAAVSDLRPLRDALDAVEQAIPAEGRASRETVDALQATLDTLRGKLQEVTDAQLQQEARSALVRDELRAIADDLAELRAAPRAAPAPAGPVAGGPAMPEPEPVAEPGLPPALQHHVARLADENDGVRFEAVDELLRSGDPRVFEHILPLAKDPDPFVRRVVLEGLAAHRTKASVEALLTALADPESIVRHTAYATLCTLTGESLPFDPDARDAERAAAQRRWRKWWEDAEASF